MYAAEGERGEGQGSYQSGCAFEVAGALIAAEFSIVSLTRRRLVALMGLGEEKITRERERPHRAGYK